jgi:6-phosphogluconolactonase
LANFSSNNISGYGIGSNGALTPVSGSLFATGVGPVPVAVNSTAKFAYVVNFSSKNVSAYSIGSNGALTPVSGSPFPAGLGPVTAYSIASNGALTPVPGSPFPAGLGPLAVAVAPMAKFAYVANFDATTSRPTTSLPMGP